MGSPERVMQVSGKRNEVSLTFLFNTPITAFKDDEFKDDVHKSRVQPLRARIKYNDGVTKCYVAQYYTEVKFFDDVTSAPMVAAIVEEAVSWVVATQQDLFPLRGNKTPRVALEDDSKSYPNAPRCVVVLFSSLLTRYFVNGNGGFDSEAYNEAVQTLAEQLTNIDGLTDEYELGRSNAALWFNPKITNRESVVVHMEQVFRAAAQEENNGLFPFLGDAQLELTYS